MYGQLGICKHMNTIKQNITEEECGDNVSLSAGFGTFNNLFYIYLENRRIFEKTIFGKWVLTVTIHE